jgi:ATP-dependent Clp protease ATP-binding subunit ClpC
MALMFERFSDAARRAVVDAQEEARGLGHNYIGTEHLLLGIMSQGGGAGARLLQMFEIPTDWVRARILEMIGRGQGQPAGHIPFTPRAKKVLEMSLREALQLGDNFIGSEHVLLGLLREGRGVAAQVLAERGVTLAGVRDRLGDVEREAAPPIEEGPRTVATGVATQTETGVVHEHEDMIHVPAEDFARLLAEVARLRDLLRHHGLDPDEPLPPEPELGDDGEPPVA